ncbi:BTAD domain-containing putative transcriptional regulator [Angustibacter sp. McL0619]|uniref:AfsR/SARP family transcriptional regulator n=1 Tax=Angustibacter sp. McL0619 TaxID=3415676 RepID=UPI003CED3DAA
MSATASEGAVFREDAGEPDLQVRLLGPVTLSVCGAVVPAGPRLQRSLLAVLAINAGLALSRSVLVDFLWGEQPPSTVSHSLHTLVWSLRRLLGSDRLERVGDGYRLSLGVGECDVLRVRQLAEYVQRRDTPAEEALAGAEAALSFWTGSPLSDVEGVAADLVRAELENLRTQLVAARVGLLIELSRAMEALSSLRSEAASDPLNERFSELLITALHQLGRRPEALAEFDRVRRALREELGLDPGPGLRAAHEKVLRGGDPERPPDRVDTRVAKPVPKPAQLPATSRDFIGRHGETAQLVGWLTQDQDAAKAEDEEAAKGRAGPRVVVLHGPGGIGKTSLGLRAAHLVAAGYPDGQLYASLRGFDPAHPALVAADVLPGFLWALGVLDEDMPAAAADQSAMFRTVLAERRMLLFLDDAPSGQVVQDLLPGTAGCAVLVTSRQRMGGLVAREGARRLDVRPMADAECVELMSHLLGAELVAGQPDQVGQLIELCSRWPLALRIAAEQVLEHDDGALGLDEVCGQLSRAGDRLLDRLGTAEEDPAMMMGEVLSWSYQRLSAADPRAAALYRLLGAGPTVHFDQHSAARLLDCPPDQAHQLLRALAARHMLEPDGVQHRMHDLVRQHARAQADLQDSPAVLGAAVDRVLAWYAAASSAGRVALGTPLKVGMAAPGEAAEQLGLGDADAATAWFSRSLDDLMACVQVAADRGHPAAWQIPLGLIGYLELANLGETRAHEISHRTGAAAAAKAGEHLAEAALLNNLSVLYERLDDPQEGVKVARRADAAAARAGAPFRVVTMLNLADCLVDVGQHDEALAVLDESLALATELGDDAWLSVSYVMLFRAHWATGQVELADRELEQAVEVAERGGAFEAASFAAESAAKTLMDVDPARGGEHVRRALDRFGDALLPYDHACLLSWLAQSEQATGDRASALQHARAAVAAFESLESFETKQFRSARALLTAKQDAR